MYLPPLCHRAPLKTHQPAALLHCLACCFITYTHTHTHTYIVLLHIFVSSLDNLIRISLRRFFSVFQPCRFGRQPRHLRYLSDPPFTGCRGNRRLSLQPASPVCQPSHGALPALRARQPHPVHDLSSQRTESC